jgi:hypothetical protein
MRSIVELLIDARLCAASVGIRPGRRLFRIRRRPVTAGCGLLLSGRGWRGLRASGPPEIPWAAIKEMRNILVHEFWQIDLATVHNIAHHDAVLLADDLDGLIKQLKSAEP